MKLSSSAALNVPASDLAILGEVLEPFQANLERVGVFGSRATGRARSSSDVDIVLHGPRDAAILWSIRGALDESSFSLPFDVVLYELCDPAIRHHIDNCEIVLWENSEHT